MIGGEWKGTSKLSWRCWVSCAGSRPAPSALLRPSMQCARCSGRGYSRGCRGTPTSRLMAVGSRFPSGVRCDAQAAQTGAATKELAQHQRTSR